MIGADASFKNLRTHLQTHGCDILHLACHARFRLENPLFSAIRLADGWATVRDVAELDLANALIVLSACETGLNEIAAGEELLGLTRGFLAAGANSLLLSLWTVNDRATAELMRHFYKHLLADGNPAAALRAAQLEFIKDNQHPYFWSPFVLIGNW